MWIYKISPENTISPFRDGARVWAASPISVIPRERVDSVATHLAASLYFSLAENRRYDLRPDGIVFSSEENRGYLRKFSHMDTRCLDEWHCPRLTPLDTFFAEVANDKNWKYVPVRLVFGWPYGVSTAYQRQPIDSLPIIPSVSLVEAGDTFWQSSMGAPLDILGELDGPMTLSLGDSKSSTEYRIGQSERIDLPAGNYLARVIVEAGENTDTEIVFATPQRHTKIKRLATNYNDAPLDTAFAIVPPKSTDVYLLLRHKGGAIWFAASGGTTFKVSSVREIATPVEISSLSNSDRIALPKVSQWEMANPLAKKLVKPNGDVVLTTNKTKWEYQLISPAIAVQSGAVMRLELPASVRVGNAALAVLSEDQRRFLASENVGETLVFETKDNERIFVVIANNNTKPLETPGLIEVSDGWMKRIDPPINYSESLVSCFTALQRDDKQNCADELLQKRGMFIGINPPVRTGWGRNEH